ncbi:hypothetical protein [uncultured Methylobacterium sp.]|uniref:hypothetical protein n=1 Tax=uncultured Methylobacterium sp. TaxID=157278 RepID=UPI0035CA8420
MTPQIKSFIIKALRAARFKSRQNNNLDSPQPLRIDRPDVAEGDFSDHQAAAHEVGHALIALEQQHRILYASIEDFYDGKRFGKQVLIRTQGSSTFFQSGGVAGSIYFYLLENNKTLNNLSFDDYLQNQIGSSIDYQQFINQTSEISNNFHELAFCLKVMRSIENNSKAFIDLVNALSQSKILSGSNVRLIKEGNAMDHAANKEMIFRYSRKGRIHSSHTSINEPNNERYF